MRRGHIAMAQKNGNRPQTMKKRAPGGLTPPDYSWSLYLQRWFRGRQAQKAHRNANLLVLPPILLQWSLLFVLEFLAPLLAGRWLRVFGKGAPIEPRA